MWSLMTIPFVWIVALIAYLVMKKIQPDESRLYLDYLIRICIVFTTVVIVYLFLV